MGAIRKHAPHRRWSEAEVATLREHYAMAPHADLFAMLPGRGLRVIQCKANGLGLVRYRASARTIEEVRTAKRESMARKRAADPAGARAYQLANYHQNRDARLITMKAYQQRRFFWLRATKLPGVTARDLASLWKNQRGLCALTGRKLDRTAQIDHIKPRARGGSDALSNLQWTCAEANLAKRDLTNAEFAALCSDVMRFIGERIAAVEALASQRAAA